MKSEPFGPSYIMPHCLFEQYFVRINYIQTANVRGGLKGSEPDHDPVIYLIAVFKVPSLLWGWLRVRRCWANFQFRGVLLIWISVGQVPIRLQ